MASKLTAGGLSAALKRLAGVPSKISRRASDNIKRQIEKDFKKGVNPYGNKWAPLAPATLAKGRTPPPLTDTGKGLAGILVNPLKGAGIGIVSSVSYMTFHQSGTSRMPARQFLPEGTLPKTWERAIDEAVNEEIKRAK